MRLRFWKKEPPPPPPPPTAWERVQASLEPVPVEAAALVPALLVGLFLVKRTLGGSSAESSRKRPPPNALESPGVKVSRSEADFDFDGDDGGYAARARRARNARRADRSRAAAAARAGHGGAARVAPGRRAPAELQGRGAGRGAARAPAPGVARLDVRHAGVRAARVPIFFFSRGTADGRASAGAGRRWRTPTSC